MAPAPISLLQLYALFFRIGLFSFGGQLTSWIHREVVIMRGWMKDEEFLSGLALAQILPGVNSTNTAVFVGQHLRGLLGAGVALAGMLTGPFFAVIAAAMSYHLLIGMEGFASIIEGVAAVALGMLARMGLAAGRMATKNLIAAVAMAATFISVGVLKWPMLLVVAVIAPLSVGLCYWRERSHEQ
jgi:chromate transporter